jgi:glycosyltransferase involved in cell wall biosynthesis
VEQTTTVTVVIPAFNAARFIERSVRSAASQTHEHVEIIVVDDGSTDTTAERAVSVADPRVRILRAAHNGISAARNRAIDEATGDVLAFLDADDLWEPDKLAAQLPLLANAVAVGGLMRYVSSTGTVLGTAGEGPAGHMEEIRRGAFMPFPISSMIARTDLVRDVGRFDPDLPCAEDLDLLQRLALRGPVAMVDQVVGSYRIHAGSASARTYFRLQEGIRFLQARNEDPSLTWTAFDSGYRRTLSMVRSDLGGYLYRSGGLAIGEGDRLKAATMLTGALVLRPTYVARRLARQRSHHRTRDQ